MLYRLVVLMMLLLHSPQAFATSASLEQKCKQLSEQSEYMYEAIYGEITTFVQFPAENMHCKNPKGCLNGKATLIYVMHQYDDEGNMVNDKIAAYVPLASEEQPMDQNAILETGQKYKFCARKVDVYDFMPEVMPSGLTIYKIDHVDTIGPN
ncbi:MAG: hypothetical protein ACTHOO_01255 [Alcanivorax sp.]